jgi:Ca-activated chloride channel homolog
LIRISSKSRHFLVATSLVFVAAVYGGRLAVPACGAQQAPAQTPLQTTTELVKVDASVIDQRGEFVGGLALKNFRILDDDAPRPIIFFAPVEAPAQVLVMIEASPAVYLIHNAHLAAAYALLDGLAVDDQVALVTYDQAPRIMLGFTTDKSALLEALGGLQYTIGMGDLSFYDSLSAVLDWMAPVTGKRAVVVLTTGIDSSPPARWEALAGKLRRADVVIYCVSLAGALRRGPSPKAKAGRVPPKSGGQEPEESPRIDVAAGLAKADRALVSLATMSGGRAYFPASDKEFVSIYHEIASALRHQYVLGIAPSHDGQFHSIAVEVLGNSGQPANRADDRVLARAGYMAPAP